MPGFIGFPELLLLGLVVLLVFGPKRLPEMGRSLGRGMREFKNSVTGDHREDEVRPELLAAATASTNGTRKPTSRTRKPATRKPTTRKRTSA